MTAVLFGVVYAAALVFLLASVARAVRYARAPGHLRWELYPVPHEEPQRVAHGGSYFEDVDWWTKPRRFHPFGELKVMVPEILFLQGLRHFNRRLWFRSFPFHFGLYLAIATAGLLLGGAAAGISILARIAAWTGGLSAALVIAGAGALLIHRLRAPDLRPYTTAGDIFNLAFFIATFSLLGASALFEPQAPGGALIAAALLRNDTTLELPPLLAAGVALAATLTAYIPLTHMAHFIAKFFTYHWIRWDDKPGVSLARYLTYRPTWSAPHLGADGGKTWAEVATTNPWAGEKK